MIKREEGSPRKFFTGAHKQVADGKGTPVLVPADAYMEVAKHFEEGAAIHSARNWEKGIPLSEIINSLERHIAAEKMGETDERHDRAIAWNALVYLATKLRVAKGILPSSLDDMPTYSALESEPCKTCDNCLGCEWRLPNRDATLLNCFKPKEDEP